MRTSIVSAWATWALGVLSLAAACGPAGARRGDASPGTSAAEDIALARAQNRRPGFTWQEFSPAALAEARRAGKYVLLDCVATWCHWCHVMDETTYTDPALGQLLRERFVALRVDVDARPDIASRYEAWGWPATVLFSPAGEQLGAYRGYLSPDELRERLQAALATEGRGPGTTEIPSALRESAPLAALGWAGVRTARDLDGYYDTEHGSWGPKQKIVMGGNLEFELLRARHGDAAALGRARFTLDQQRALLDPVWGGLYQYSTGGDWAHPHFEKRLAIQAAGIEAYARAYALTGELSFVQAAADIDGYVRRFLQNKDGEFLVSQDADLGGYAHDPAGEKPRFVDGHDYYKKDDAGRRALGLPRVDDHVYAQENGQGIAALCTLAASLRQRATGAEDAARHFSADAEPLRRAEHAAERLLRSHVTADGSVVRLDAAGKAQPVRYLADAAALGRGLACLAAQTRKPAYLTAASRIATALARDFGGGPDGLLLASTPDPAAGGVFARRQAPFDPNVVAARFLLSLSRLGGGPALRQRALTLLSGLAAPARLADQGRWLGEFLVALDEAGVLPWVS